MSQMSNAAIYLHPNAFDTTGPTLLGRHSAGESFLRGFLRHADVDRYLMLNVARRPTADLDALLQRIQPPTRPVTWLDRGRLSQAGVLNMPTPELPAEAWHRRAVGQRAYAICGITHTTATATVMRVLPDLLIAPVEDYDTLICTSHAVRQSVEVQLDGVRDYLLQEYGQRRRAEAQRVTIPLGVNVADFPVDGGRRKAWRDRLEIPDDAVVALYVGRFEVRTKMNPALMAMALEKAAQASDRPIVWLNSGWAEGVESAEIFHREARALCPSVRYIEIDGRPADVRFAIWSAADFFISLSDNIQETFGLTPVEAMAAGLPCVVTDWNGYKDTVRHGEDGFRIPTRAPAAGQGGDLAYAFANGWLNYESYVGAAGQFTALDLGAAAEAIAALVRDPELRRRMGASAQARAREVFDWAAIIPQYQALWAEQDARRRAAPPEPAPRANPFRPDPFTLFANYPTRHLAGDDEIMLTPGMTWGVAGPRLAAPLAAYSAFNRPTALEAEQVLAWLAQRPKARVSEVVEAFPENRRSYVSRGLLWLARHDVIMVLPRP